MLQIHLKTGLWNERLGASVSADLLLARRLSYLLRIKILVKPIKKKVHTSIQKGMLKGWLMYVTPIKI